MLENEEDEGVVNLLVVDKSVGSIVATCGGCGQGVIGSDFCPGCGVHMHELCGDELGERGLGSMWWCSGCRR